MKILHVSTFLTGGAPVAALKIHNDLLASGIASRFLFLKGAGNPLLEKVYQYNRQHRQHYLQSLYTRISHKLIAGGAAYENFSYPYSRYDISQDYLVQEADIIHLHWVADFIDYPTFFTQVKKPIVWTLHDMNPFSGGFHYEDDALFNTSPALGQRDAAIRAFKRNLFKQVDNLTIVAPSQWMLEASKASAPFAAFPHFHVPYSIDPRTFSMQDKKAARTALGLPERNTIFTFLSARLSTKRKGFDILLQSIRLLLAEQQEDITIVNIGDGACDISCAVNMGSIKDQRKIAQVLSASDALLLPSREDNFPNVMMEANACGCPVIAFPVGGIREFIQDGFNGVLTENVSARALKAAMQSFIRNKSRFEAEKIKDYVLDKYAPALQASRYIDIYKGLIR